MYEIKFSSSSAKFFRKLQTNLQDRIRAKFKEISLDPFRFIEHYEGDYYKIRIGEFRALVDIDKANKLILVRVFDKRGRIYK